MSPFRFKIKGYLNEAGEYSPFHAAESGTILQFIIQHWFNETLPNNLDIVIIQNEAGDQLIIDHLKRDVFDYYFIEKKSKRTYYHKKTDIQFMFFVLECFFNNRNEDIRYNLNATVDDWRFILGDYRGKDFTYKITNKRIWANLDALIYPLTVLALSFVFALITSIYAIVIVGLIFCLLFAVGSYSNIKRLISYYDDNKDLELRFSRGDDFLHIKKGTWSQSIPKTDIRNILKYRQPVNEASMLDFYTEIEFINGNILNLTCLLVPQEEIELKFANDLASLESKVSNGKLVRPTNLDKYFSAIKPVGI